MSFADATTEILSNDEREDASQPALCIRGLRKSFGALTAVDDLSISVPSGQLYGLLGLNGAGKTTTLRMIAGLLAPDAGTVSVFGANVWGDPLPAKQVIAWLPDEPMLYDKLTPLEYLEFVAGLWRMEGTTAAKRADELLQSLSLSSRRNERCETPDLLTYPD